MRPQRKSPPQEPVLPPNRTVSPARHGLQRRGPEALQPRARRLDRRCGGPRGRIHRPSERVRLSAKLGRKPPRFPLTLRAMLGSRHHQDHAWNRSFLSLLSVLALLAFALVPAAASADSAGVEYETETPSAYGSHPSTPTVQGGGGNDGGKAHASNESGGVPAGGEGGSGSGGSSGGGDAGTGSGTGGGQNTGGNGSTNPQHANGGGDSPGKLNVQNSKPVSSEAEDDGGSSPVVPIVILVLLLAAVSAGIVIMRQRRQTDSPAAPKAG